MGKKKNKVSLWLESNPRSPMIVHGRALDSSTTDLQQLVMTSSPNWWLSLIRNLLGIIELLIIVNLEFVRKEQIRKKSMVLGLDLNPKLPLLGTTSYG